LPKTQLSGEQLAKTLLAVGCFSCVVREFDFSGNAKFREAKRAKKAGKNTSLICIRSLFEFE